MIRCASPLLPYAGVAVRPPSLHTCGNHSDGWIDSGPLTIAARKPSSISRSMQSSGTASEARKPSSSSSSASERGSSSARVSVMTLLRLHYVEPHMIAVIRYQRNLGRTLVRQREVQRRHRRPRAASPFPSFRAATNQTRCRRPSRTQVRVRRAVGGDQRAKFLRCHRRDVESRALDTGAHVGRLQGGHDIALQRVDDRRRRAGHAHHRRPRVHRDRRAAGLGVCRQLRIVRQSLVRRDRECPQLAEFRESGHRPHRQHREIDVTAGHGGHQRASVAKRHVQQLHVGRQRHALDGDVPSGARCQATRKLTLARVRDALPPSTRRASGNRRAPPTWIASVAWNSLVIGTRSRSQS